jgi:putative transposase
MNHYDPKIHHRRSIRLREYDYSQAGLYFITICTQNRLHLLGKIVNGEMILNDAGKMILGIWHEIPVDFQNARLRESVIMPNHIHGIIEIPPVGADSISAPSMHPEPIDANMQSKRPNMESDHTGEIKDNASLSDMVQSFKRHSTIEYMQMVKRNMLQPFNKRVWQRNYWEHIIRNDDEYGKIAQYIVDNPCKWDTDSLNGGTGNRVLESLGEYNVESWMV